MKIIIDNEVFENVLTIQPVYQKHNNKSHWIFLYFKPGTTEYNHFEHFDQIAVEYNPFKSYIKITN